MESVMEPEQNSGPDTVLVELTAEIVSAYASNNTVSSKELCELLKDVHATLALLAVSPDQSTPLEPAVPIKKSVTDDFLICLEDGKKFKSLKRYLRSKYNMTPDEYRQKWKLPPDYPMVAPSYARQRSELAKKMGLGQTAKP